MLVLGQLVASVKYGEERVKVASDLSKVAERIQERSCKCAGEPISSLGFLRRYQVLSENRMTLPIGLPWDGKGREVILVCRIGEFLGGETKWASVCHVVDSTQS